MKKTRIILTTAALLITVTMLGQNKPSSFIAFTVGASLPVGDFSKSEAGSFGNWNNTAGFAKPSFAIGAEAAYYLTSKFGIGGTLYFSDHGGFSQSDVAKLGDSYTDAFAVDQSTVTTTGRYRSLNIMIGPCLSFPMNKFTIDLRAFVGLLQSLSTPEVTVQLEDQTDATFKQTSSAGSAFGWQVGGGFRYALTDRIGFVMRTDYFYSEGVKVDNENRANNAGRLVTSQPMSWLNASGGISFSIGNR